LSIFPNTKGVTVVIPKDHYDSYIFAVPDKVRTDLMAAAQKVAKAIDKAFPDVDRTGVVFEGFGVNHLHAKLFPLHGTSEPEWQKRSSSVDKYFENYEGYISSHDYQRADDQELANIAAQIHAVAK
jgi:diadenosine tetraphosphate (Ap4A) HIT family hydrolase